MCHMIRTVAHHWLTGLPMAVFSWTSTQFLNAKEEKVSPQVAKCFGVSLTIYFSGKWNFATKEEVCKGEIWVKKDKAKMLINWVAAMEVPTTIS